MSIKSLAKTASENKNTVIRRAVIIGGALLGIAIATPVVLSKVKQHADDEIEVTEDIIEINDI